MKRSFHCVSDDNVSGDVDVDVDVPRYKARNRFDNDSDFISLHCWPKQYDPLIVRRKYADSDVCGRCKSIDKRNDFHTTTEHYESSDYSTDCENSSSVFHSILSQDSQRGINDSSTRESSRLFTPTNFYVVSDDWMSRAAIHALSCAKYNSTRTEHPTILSGCRYHSPGSNIGPSSIASTQITPTSFPQNQLSNRTSDTVVEQQITEDMLDRFAHEIYNQLNADRRS